MQNTFEEPYMLASIDEILPRDHHSDLKHVSSSSCSFLWDVNVFSKNMEIFLCESQTYDEWYHKEREKNERNKRKQCKCTRKENWKRNGNKLEERNILFNMRHDRENMLCILCMCMCECMFSWVANSRAAKWVCARMLWVNVFNARLNGFCRYNILRLFHNI